MKKTVDTLDKTINEGFDGGESLRSRVLGLENLRDFVEDARQHWTDYTALFIAVVAALIAFYK